jgi:hypothetical protein
LVGRAAGAGCVGENATPKEATDNLAQNEQPKI